MQLHDCHKIRIVRKNVLANASREIFPVDGSIKVNGVRRKKIEGKYLTYYRVFDHFWEEPEKFREVFWEFVLEDSWGEVFG